jgi:hypothetical protein
MVRTMTIHARIAIGLIRLPWLRADQPSEELLGHWVSLERTLHHDGTIDSSRAVVSEMAYRVEGGNLVFLPHAKAAPEQRVKIEFAGLGQLRIREKRDKFRRF